MEALIDGDLVAYRCACTCEEDETNGIVLFRVNELVERILASVNADSYTIYIGGDSNFRYSINPDYKANRKDKPKPKWLNDCREFLVTEWGAKITEGIEADDALSIHQRDDTIICSIDKDMLQVKGKHYNFVKEEFYDITELEGLKAFYRQLLIGDTSDNIRGVDGIGKVKAAKQIDSLLEEMEMYMRVQDLYADPQRFKMNADCLWLMRKEGERYSNRQISVEV